MLSEERKKQYRDSKRKWYKDNKELAKERANVYKNIQVISHKANILKNNATLSELILLGEWAKIQLIEDES